MGIHRSTRLARGGPVRTLAVLHAAEVGGPLRSLEAELRWLATLGPLTLAVPASGRVAAELASWGDVRRMDLVPLMIPSGPGAAIRALGRLIGEQRRVRALIRSERPDLVVVVSSLLPGAVVAAWRERTPSLVYAAEIHDDPALAVARRLVGAAAIALVARCASVVIVCSEAVAAQFPGRRSEKVHVVYPPIARPPHPGDGQAFRRRHGLDPAAPCVVVVGNTTRGRGQDLMVRALPRIRDAIPGTQLALVGPTFERPKDIAFERELRALVGHLGVADAVRFAGYEPRIDDAFAAADLVVNPARTSESFGRVACEALVAGCPVVSTRVGAVPEVLGSVPGATLVQARSPEAIATAAVNALADPEAADRARMGGDAIQARFSAERSLGAFKDLVGSIT